MAFGDIRVISGIGIGNSGRGIFYAINLTFNSGMARYSKKKCSLLAILTVVA